MGVVAFGLFALALNLGASEDSARNLTLMLMVLFENVHALNSRSERNSLFAMPWLSNPLLIGIIMAQSIHIRAAYIPGINHALGLNPISIQQWLILLATALTLLIVDEQHKTPLA
jgi:magnesium-transporting ATPase (P-type)